MGTVLRLLEAERRAAQELEIAKQVQARLFPQILPALRTLDYAGACIQAHAVGGDYYDFMDLGRERIVVSLHRNRLEQAADGWADLQAEIIRQLPGDSGLTSERAEWLSR
jgi:serine phosphatase RsbU (regulator of sigma subunit)